MDIYIASWHIVYGVPGGSSAQAAALAKERGAGLVHITTSSGDNPYNTLPSDTFMQALVNAVDDGKPAIASPLEFKGVGTNSAVPRAMTQKFDYSSVWLAWTSSDTPALFGVHASGNEVARIPGIMTRVTIGNLTPGTLYNFIVRGISGDGKMSGDSNFQMVPTYALPDNKAVVNATNVPGTSSTTFKARILVLFGFVRLYITDLDGSCEMPA